MSELLAKDKEIVVPGQVVANGMEFLPSEGTYRLNEEIIVNRLGILSIEGKVIRTIPLSGRYLPKRGDVVIGKVADILMSGWRFEINSPYSSVLPLKDASFDYIEKGEDLSRYFALEDYAVVKITNVTSQNLIDVTAKGPGLRRLRGGRIIEVPPAKVPRIIGKNGSMVSMLKLSTGCKIIVGQNGIVWMQGEPEMEVIACDAIKKIERESHISGLTERVKKFLEDKTGKPVPESTPENSHDDEMMSHSGGGDRGHGEFRERRNYDDRRPQRGGPRPHRGGYGGGNGGGRGYSGPPRQDGNWQ